MHSALSLALVAVWGVCGVRGYSSFGITSRVRWRTRCATWLAAGEGESDAFDKAFEAFGERLKEEKARREEAVGGARGDRSSKEPNTAAPVRRRSRSADKERQRAVMIEQGPSAELRELQAAPFYGWAQEDDTAFFKRLGFIYGGTFALVGLPIALVTYSGEDERLTAIVAGSNGALAVVLVLLFRLAIGWGYIKDRLESDVLDFEESGWYDGFLSKKSDDVAKRDKLLASLEVTPVVKRLTKASLGFAAVFLASAVLLKVQAPEDPYKMFDPTYLESLSRDDDAAAEAASMAGGKPAYCKSRYYKVIAGGGLCD